MAFQIYQNKKKDGTLYYTAKADQQGTLTCADGQYKDGLLVLLITNDKEAGGDYEVLRIENRKRLDTEPYEFPLTVSMKIDPKGTIQEQALHKYFTEIHPELASGFGGQITYVSMPATQAIAKNDYKPHHPDSFAELVSIADSKIEFPKGSGNDGGGYYKSSGQSEAGKLSDRVEFLTKTLTADTEENKAYVLTGLKIENYLAVMFS